MSYITGKVYFAFIIFFVLLISGCKTGNNRGDILPITVEADETSELQVTNETEIQAMSAELPTEIIESISPISPILPTGEAQPTDEPSPTGEAESEGSFTFTVEPSTPIEPLEGSEDVLAIAIDDLSKQVDVPVDEIILVSMEAIEWNDSSLGCPQEGFMYAQVITPGYLMLLEADGKQYEYHTDQTRNVTLCEK